ncbi:MAG TPA: hypothetical protein DEB46_14330 [Myxococcales bacterium]|nr:hypothetical protein [Myxococcales bacterium]
MPLLFSWLILGVAPTVGLQAEDGATRPKVLVLDLVNSAELTPETLEALQDAILGGLSGAPVQIMGAADIAKLMEVQQGNVTLGCLRDDCLFDLAKAWQARYVISGSLAMVARRAILNLKLLDAGAEVPKVLHRESHESEPKALTALVRVTAARMRQALGGSPPTDKEMEVLKVARLPRLGLALSLVSSAFGAFAVVSHLDAKASAETALQYRQDGLAVELHMGVMERHLAQRNVRIASAFVAGLAATYAWMKQW